MASEYHDSQEGVFIRDGAIRCQLRERVILVEKEVLYEALNGLYAYDTGSVDSGIKDELLRGKVKNYLTTISGNDVELLIAKYVREYYLSDEALEEGYGLEDVIEFSNWLDEFIYEDYR